MMAQAEERGESGSATKDWRNRLESAKRQRYELERIIAQNTPVRLDGALPIERDPNSRMRREG
jgi:hypothetical protein